MVNTIKMPQTPFSFWVWFWNLILAILLWFLLGKLEEWRSVVFFLILGLGAGFYLISVPGFYATMVLNHFTGNQRTLFQGLNLILPWESKTKSVDLRVALHEAKTETYPSQDALMEGRYVYTIRPKLTSEGVILFNSFELDAIKQSARALFSMSLSDYYGKHSSDDLLNKEQINNDVFRSTQGINAIQRFEKNHGADVTVQLEDSDFNAKTQKFRDMVAGATSFDNAINILRKGGMSKKEAERVAKLMNFENVQENIFTIDAKDLKNLQNVSILGAIPGSKTQHKK